MPLSAVCRLKGDFKRETAKIRSRKEGLKGEGRRMYFHSVIMLLGFHDRDTGVSVRILNTKEK